MSKVDTITVPDEIREQIRQMAWEAVCLRDQLLDLRKRHSLFYAGPFGRWIDTLPPDGATVEEINRIHQRADEESGYEKLVAQLHRLDDVDLIGIDKAAYHDKQWIDLGSGVVGSPMVSAMCQCGWVANLHNEVKVDTLALAMRSLAAHRQDCGLEVWAEDYPVIVDDRAWMSAEEIDAAFAQAKAAGPIAD